MVTVTLFFCPVDDPDVGFGESHGFTIPRFQSKVPVPRFQMKNSV
jgi:hypothetical protein